MTKRNTVRLAVLVLGMVCLAWGQQPAETPAQPQQQPPAQSGQQPTVAPDGGPLQENDPRVDQPDQPLPPVAPPQDQAQTIPVPPEAPMVPDTTPLNSPMELTLGTTAEESAGGGNFVSPTLRFTEFVNTGSGRPTEGISNISGSLQARHSWAHTTASLNYTIGGSLYAVNSDFDSYYQNASLSTSFQYGRWSFSLSDNGSYLPESSFGFFGTQFNGGPPTPGGIFNPNQSILVGVTQLANTVTAEARYQFGPKFTIHFSESWGILRFQGGGGGLQNSNQYVSTAGFDRIFGANTLGIAYTGGRYSYGGNAQNNGSHSISFAYARRVTGKLALQVSGGPQIQVESDPKLGSVNALSWRVSGGLTYRLASMVLSTALFRDSTGGAGVLTGAQTLSWTGGMRRSIGRIWGLSVNGGYSRNSTLQVNAPVNTAPRFNAEFVGAQLSRPLGRNFSLSLTYNYQHQTSDIPLCVACGLSFDRHMFGVGFDWHQRPAAFKPLG